RNQRRRWGSCAADGTLRFNWRVMLLEPALIDYIVVHELAHLTHMNHSPAFWELVCQTIPDARHRRKRLRETSRALPF
ncbi:MAG: M48 family metallopeptidase, partial [Chloroflexi bacterium]|nr:M48 family metallopeptidase [Chloroflexota bacterium]